MGWAEARSDACPQGRSGRAGDRRLPPLRTAEAVSGGLCLPLSQEVSDKRGITKQKHKRGITKQKPRTSQEGLEDCRGVLPPLARPPGPRRGAAAAGRPERACCLLLLLLARPGRVGGLVAVATCVEGVQQQKKAGPEPSPSSPHKTRCGLTWGSRGVKNGAPSVYNATPTQGGERPDGAVCVWCECLPASL